MMDSKLQKRFGLSLDEADLVSELLNAREAYRAYLKAVETMVAYREADVIRMSSAEGPEKLFHAKLRAEGARSLLTEMQALITKK